MLFALAITFHVLHEFIKWPIHAKASTLISTLPFQLSLCLTHPLHIHSNSPFSAFSLPLYFIYILHSSLSSFSRSVTFFSLSLFLSLSHSPFTFKLKLTLSLYLSLSLSNSLYFLYILHSSFSSFSRFHNFLSLSLPFFLSLFLSLYFIPQIFRKQHLIWPVKI